MNILRKISASRILKTMTLMCGALAAACGGGGGGGGGGGNTSLPPPPPAVSTMNVSFSAADVVAGSSEAGAATGTIEYNETDGRISATVTLSMLTADAVAIRSGAAGSTGAERFTLAAGTSASDWVLADTPLAAADVTALESAQLYLLVTTASAPDGALRGQVLPNGIAVERISLDALHVTAGSNSQATARAWATVDDNTSVLTLHVVTNSLDDSDTAALHDALAGQEGPVLAPLAQDPADATHWFAESIPYSQAIQGAAAVGATYLQLTSPGYPDGAVRGQFVPETLELVITDLDDDRVVMGGPSIAASPYRATIGRVMTTIGPNVLTSNVNLFDIDDADSVAMHRAPAGQNGPPIATMQQDINNPRHWTLVGHAIDAALQAGLDNRTVYVQVTTPASPNGLARGQIRTAASMRPADESAFIVLQVTPANDASVPAFPDNISAVLNRPPLAMSVSPQSIRIEASGGDGSFGDGNETTLTPAAVSVDGNDVSMNMSGVAVGNDVFRVSLFGSGDAAIVDTSGIPLDGDRDGSPGGTFESAFEYETPPATFSSIQATIFTPSCAISGCHTGGNPPDELNLSDGLAYDNIVSVNSVQMPSLLRIEPGDPNNSYLVRKVEGNGIVANRMPLGSAPLSQEQIDLLRQWVAEGAGNN